MSTVRTPEQLVDALSEDLAWRKKDISAFRFFIESGSVHFERKSALIRAGVALLYAHWEGFIKYSSRRYIELVHFQRLPYARLSPNFVSLGARALVNRAAQTSKIGFHLVVTDFYTNKLNDICELSCKEGLSTKSNLSSDVLRDIVETLGLDYSFYETKANFIDERLLKNRNTIAHGSYLAIDNDAFMEMSEITLEMIETFRNQVENAAILKSYRRP